MTQPNVLEMMPNEPPMTNAELKASNDDIQRQIEELTAMIGEPEKLAEGTQLLQEVQALLPEGEIRIRSKKGFTESWELVRDQQTKVLESEAIFVPVIAAAAALHKKLLANLTYYTKDVVKDMGKRKEGLSDHWEKETRKKDILQLEGEAKARADAGPGEAAKAFVAPFTLSEIEGGSIFKLFKAQVNDMPALIAAVVDGEAKPEFLKPDQAKLNAAAKVEQGGFHLPGVSAVWKPVVRINKRS